MKTRYIFILAAMGLLASCAKQMEIAPDVQESTGVKTVLQVGIDLETKTFMGDLENGSRKVFWSNGDQIRVNGKASAALTEQPDSSQTAFFSFDVEPGLPYNVVYPAGIYKDATHVTLPDFQTWKEGNFADGMFPMAGYSADGTNVTLKHLCAVVKVSILRATGEGADTDDLLAVRFRGRNSEQVKGLFTIDYQNATLTGASADAADKEVKVVYECSTASGAEYFIVVPAGAYTSGFDIIIQDKGGHFMTKSKKSSVTLEAGKLYTLADFSFIPGEGVAASDIVITSAQELIDFATAYNNGDYSQYNGALTVTVANDLEFDAETSAAFNTTGGIGTNDDGNGGTNHFNGLFEGNEHTISGLAATVPLFAYVGGRGVIQDIVMASNSSLIYSADISSDTNLGVIAGYCKGNVTNCVNYAPVICSSANREGGVLKIGGIVGRQNKSGTISNCKNYAAVTCTAPGTPDIYMGGIAGTVERASSGDTANIENCTNAGIVKNGLDSGEPAQPCILHMGGVVGWINSTSNSPAMTISGLVNTGNVIKTNNSVRADAKPVLVGGIVGGIHGKDISTASGEVAIVNSHVKNCRIQTGDFNNSNGYGEASQVGGFVAVARGNQSSKNISFTDCSVKGVFVTCRRGFAGGFVSWTRGAVLTGCQVLNSSVRGNLAQCWYAGGIAGCAYDSDLTDCIALLTKEDANGDAYDSYTLFANGSNSMAGGIVAQARGTTTIDGCKAFVKKMYQGTAGKEAYRGWIAGYVEASSAITIKDCAIGGACASAPAVTLDTENFSDYLYGSKGADATVTLQGTNSYWDAGDAPTGNTIVTIVISEYAAANDWIDGGTNYYNEITQGAVTLTASAKQGYENGNYNTQWRFYQARGGGLTISVSGGHSLVSATFTYNYTNTGVLLAPDGVTQIPSGNTCSLSGSSAFFSLGNTGSATNGQVRFTQIVVEYD